MKRPTADLSAATRVLNVVTHPTQVIRRAEVRAQEALDGPSPLLSRALLIGAACAVVPGVVIAVVGVLIKVPAVLLLGFVLLSAGMAAASLEGLLWPEPEWMTKMKALVRR